MNSCNLVTLYNSLVILTSEEREMSGKSQSPRGPQVEMEPEIGGKSEDVNDETKEIGKEGVLEMKSKETKTKIATSKDEMKMVR